MSYSFRERQSHNIEVVTVDTLYKHKASLMPKVKGKNPILRFFCFCGKQSLWIYLLHQPILNGICYLITESSHGG